MSKYAGHEGADEMWIALGGDRTATTIMNRVLSELDGAPVTVQALRELRKRAQRWSNVGLQALARIDTVLSPNPAARIAWKYIIESNNSGGIDAGDLAFWLERAGYPCPPDLADE